MTNPLQERKNRGKSSEDDKLFGNPNELNKLYQALDDMYYLMSKEYSIKSTLALVSLRYCLKPRQILSLQGMSCSEKDIQKRKEKELNHTQLLGKTIHIDGFNLVILLESLFSEAYVFQGLDGC